MGYGERTRGKEEQRCLAVVHGVRLAASRVYVRWCGVQVSPVQCACSVQHPGHSRGHEGYAGLEPLSDNWANK